MSRQADPPSEFAPIPPRTLDAWVEIEGTDTGRAGTLVVNSLAMPDESSMVDVTICYPVTAVSEHQRVARAVRIDLHKVYFQSFSSGIGSYLTEDDAVPEIWSLCVTDRSDLKDSFIAGLGEWSAPQWLPPASEHLRHFSIGRDHHGYLNFLAVDAAVRFFEVDWAAIDVPYDPTASYRYRLQRQHVKSRWLDAQAALLGLPIWER